MQREGNFSSVSYITDGWRERIPRQRKPTCQLSFNDPKGKEKKPSSATVEEGAKRQT